MFIIKAAIMFSNGEVLEGRNYSDIVSLASKIGVNGERINGFLTSSGDFVLPEEAAKIAFSSGQLRESTEGLAPEDLWPSIGVEC